MSHKDAATGTAAFAAPSLDVDLPGAGEECVRILGIHGDLGGAGVFVNEENALPGLAAVLSAEDAALRLWSVAGAESGDKDDVRIVRIDDDAAYATGCVESHVLPGLAGIS